MKSEHTLGEIYIMLKDMKSKVDETHDKVHKINGSVQVHEEKINNNKTQINGLSNKLWVIGSGTILGLIGAFINFVINK